MSSLRQYSDNKLIDNLTAKLYKSICFDIGERPPVENLKQLFIISANMIRNDGDLPETMTVDDFIVSYTIRINDGAIKSFYEGEIHNITEIFGKIAHRFSTYEVKFELNDHEPFSVGINSIQYIKIDNEWKISSIVWNNQTDDLRIPNRYI